MHCISSRHSPSLTFHKPLGPYALVQQPGSPQGPGDPVGPSHRSITVIREGNYTHNLFNGPQVQQRREAHKDPDQGGLLPHRREQEVQEHISESSIFILKFQPQHFINKSARWLNEVSETEILFFFAAHTEIAMIRDKFILARGLQY